MVFSKTDQSILMKGMEILPFWERQILIYRFWENLTIEEISNLLKISWDEVNESLERSFKVLREVCMNNSDFQRLDSEQVA